MKKSLRLASVALALVMVTSVMLSGTFAKYTSEFAGQDTALVARWEFAGSDGMVDGNTQPKTLDIFSHEYDKYITATGTDSDNQSSSIIAPGVKGDFNIEFNYTGDVDAAITLALSKSTSVNGDIPLQFSLTSDFTNITYNLNDLAEQILQNCNYKTGTTGAAKPVFDGTWTEVNQDTPDIATLPSELNKVLLGSATITPALQAFALATTDPIAEAKSPLNTIVVTKTELATDTTYVNIPVYWRWPYDVSEHSWAQKLTEGGFTSPWTDANDTALGIASQAANRLEYRINVNVTATQVVPEQ